MKDIGKRRADEIYRHLGKTLFGNTNEWVLGLFDESINCLRNCSKIDGLYIGFKQRLDYLANHAQSGFPLPPQSPDKLKSAYKEIGRSLARDSYDISKVTQDFYQQFERYAQDMIEHLEEFAKDILPVDNPKNNSRKEPIQRDEVRYIPQINALMAKWSFDQGLVRHSLDDLLKEAERRLYFR